MRYFYNGDLDWKVFRADDGSAGVDLINNGETVVIEPNGGTAVLGTCRNPGRVLGFTCCS